MLAYFKKRLKEGYWTHGSIWEFDWYLDVFFSEVMSFGHYPVFLGYQTPILGDEYLDFIDTPLIVKKYNDYFAKRRNIHNLALSQSKILASSDEIINSLRQSHFDSNKYEEVQKNLSLLQASVSVIFDPLVEKSAKKIAEEEGVNDDVVINHIIESSSHTKLNESNKKLLSLYKFHRKEIEKSNFSFKKLDKILQSAIRQHALEYGWLNTGERGNGEWVPQDFLSQMQSLKLSKKNDHSLPVPDSIKNKSQMFIEIALNDNLAADKQVELDFLFQKFLKEKLRGYYIESIVENLTYQEIMGLLDNPTSLKKYHKRNNNYRRVVWPEARKLNFYYFKSASEFKSVTRLVSHIGKTAQSISGMVACKGSAEGKVRIIKSQKDLDSFQDGEILVAVKTQPKYVMTMTKALGIVTDNGGITSHAAIISREFHVPCIVGTENATKILKNSDIVRLNTDNGTVLKLD